MGSSLVPLPETEDRNLILYNEAAASGPQFYTTAPPRAGRIGLSNSAKNCNRVMEDRTLTF